MNDSHPVQQRYRISPVNKINNSENSMQSRQSNVTLNLEMNLYRTFATSERATSGLS